MKHIFIFGEKTTGRGASLFEVGPGGGVRDPSPSEYIAGVARILFGVRFRVSGLRGLGFRVSCSADFRGLNPQGPKKPQWFSFGPAQHVHAFVFQGKTCFLLEAAAETS